MSFDIDYRYRRALQPDGLATYETALRALNEAVDDVRLAGREAATCPAVRLLTRHLARISDGQTVRCEAEDRELREACLTRLAELKHAPAIIGLVRRGLDYRQERLTLAYANQLPGDPTRATQHLVVLQAQFVF